MDKDLIKDFNDSVESLGQFQADTGEQIKEVKESLTVQEKSLAEVKQSIQVIRDNAFDKPVKWKGHELTSKFIRFCYHGFVANARNLNDSKVQASKDWLAQTFQKADITTTTGATLIPTEFYPELYRILLQNSVLLQDGRGLPMGTDSMTMPDEATGFIPDWYTEGSDITAGEPTYGELSFPVLDLGLYGVVTAQALDDAKINLLAELIISATQAAGREVDAAGFLGTSAYALTLPVSQQDNGIFNWAAHEQVNTTAGAVFTPTYEDLVNGIYDNLSTMQLAGGRFYMSPSVFGNVKSLTDSQGAPIWVPTAGSADANTIVGFPYTLVDILPSNADAALSTTYMMFGNLQNYVYGDRQQLSFARSDHAHFQANKVGLRFVLRIAYPVVTSATGIQQNFVKWTSAAA